LAKQAGIPVIQGFFIIGNRDETFLDVLQTWWLVLTSNVWPTFSICTPFPGTALYQMLKEEGAIPKNVDLSMFNQVTPVIKTSRMSTASVFLLYTCSVAFLQLPLSLSRGHNFRHTVSKISNNAWRRLAKRHTRALS
jgi:radical SAM superfamily enzyme YgiQ (UPF0313 family)